MTTKIKENKLLPSKKSKQINFELKANATQTEEWVATAMCR